MPKDTDANENVELDENIQVEEPIAVEEDTGLNETNTPDIEALDAQTFEDRKRALQWEQQVRNADLNAELARLEAEESLATTRKAVETARREKDIAWARNLADKQRSGGTLSEDEQRLVSTHESALELQSVKEAKELLDVENESLKLKGNIAKQKATNQHAEAREHLEAFNSLYSTRNQTIEKAALAIPTALRPNEIGADMEDIKWQDFSSQDAATLLRLNAASYQPDGPSGIYFRLSINQRIELLEDVIGFYSGYVIDSDNPSHPIRQSDRNLWHVPEPGVDYKLIPQETDATRAAAKRSAAPRDYPFPIFRIPQVTGYITNHYTFNLTTHQQQISNVLDWGASATVGGGTATGSVSGAVSGAYRSADNETGMEALSTRTVYLAANFVLPKAELIRDFSPTRPNSRERLSQAFIDELERALEVAESTKKDEESPEKIALSAEYIFNVLSDYGHFAARSVSIGGRLVAFQSKHLREEQTASDAARQHLIAAKAALDSVYVNAQGEMSHTEAGRDQDKSKDVAETQALQFRAVGGQGDLITNPSLWSRSMTDYKSWRAVESRDMFPSVLLLPEKLQSRVLDRLRTYVEDKWVSDLFARGLRFVVQGAYFDILGRYAKQGYFMIRNATERDLVLTVPANITTDSAPGGNPLSFDKVDNERTHDQQWYLSGEYIISRGAWENREPRYLFRTASLNATYNIVAVINNSSKDVLNFARWDIQDRVGDSTVSISPRTDPQLTLTIPTISSGGTARGPVNSTAMLEENKELERQRWLLDFV